MDKCVMTARGLLEQERKSGRVVMGYLLGLTLTAYFANDFLEYAALLGEPVNILETFCVTEHNILFLILGWLLVVADAPFVKKNTYLLLYRCGTRLWNMGMILYLFSQAFFYTACLAVFTVAISCSRGFAGSVWSSPVYFLVTDLGKNARAGYHVFFSLAMTKYMTVPQAFAVTFLFMYLYLVVLGMFLYVCNLVMPGILGAVITLCVHMLGYLLNMGGYTRFSLLARSVPGTFMDGTLRYWNSAVLFLGLIAAAVFLSAFFSKKTDFRAGTGGDA